MIPAIARVGSLRGTASNPSLGSPVASASVVSSPTSPKSLQSPKSTHSVFEPLVLHSLVLVGENARGLMTRYLGGGAGA